MNLPDTELADDYLRSLLASEGPIQRVMNAPQAPPPTESSTSAEDTARNAEADRVSKETIAREKIASEERVALKKIEAETTTKDKTEPDDRAILESLVKGQDAMAQALKILAQAITAPREIKIEREQGQITGANTRLQ